MSKVVVEFQVPKEGKELVDAVAAIVRHFVDGKSIVEAGALLQPILAAVDGVQLISEEIKSDGRDELAGYLVQQVLGVLQKTV